MKIYGTKVDTEAIAAGLLRMVDDLDECYANALRLGMLPAPLMECLDRLLKERAARFAPRLEVQGVEPAEWVRTVTHAVSVEMYKQAEMVV